MNLFQSRFFIGKEESIKKLKETELEYIFKLVLDLIEKYSEEPIETIESLAFSKDEGELDIYAKRLNDTIDKTKYSVLDIDYRIILEESLYKPTEQYLAAKYLLTTTCYELLYGCDIPIENCNEYTMITDINFLYDTRLIINCLAQIQSISPRENITKLMEEIKTNQGLFDLKVLKDLDFKEFLIDLIADEDATDYIRIDLELSPNWYKFCSENNINHIILVGIGVLAYICGLILDYGDCYGY